MNSFLLQAERGGTTDTYSFTTGDTKVEVLHYEDGEYRSEQVLDLATAYGLWRSLKTFGYVDGGTKPNFVPSPSGVDLEPHRRIAVGIGNGLLAASAFWAVVGVIVALLV